MDLKASLTEFSELLEVAACSLRSIIENRSAPGGESAPYVDEVSKIAERLRKIGEEIST